MGLFSNIRIITIFIALVAKSHDILSMVVWIPIFLFMGVYLHRFVIQGPY